MSETGFSSFSVLQPPFSVTFDIDTIVRQIMVDLTEKPETFHADIKTNIKDNVKTKIQGEVKNDIEKSFVNEIYLDNRVISLADLNERISGATKLFISPKSILTPSAKDELQKRKIEVAVKLPLLPSLSNSAVSNSAVWLAFHKPATFPYNLLNKLQKTLVLKQKSFTTLAELLNEAEQQLSEETTRGVAVTKQSATAIRLANCCNNIRAVGCVDVKQTTEDTAELNANLLVIHPERINNTEIFEIIKRLSIS
ncbi:MAG: hypothetical protein LBP87_07605 [Planctomycetaceae bacterium]|jgi:hypothetical protein|nr:hypothetical protein [Planctomycetaceae bacterium]